MTIEEKRAKWQKEINENNEFLDWFYGDGGILSGAQAYMGCLDRQGYEYQAQKAKKRNEELKRKIQYARR